MLPLAVGGYGTLNAMLFKDINSLLITSISVAVMMRLRPIPSNKIVNFFSNISFEMYLAQGIPWLSSSLGWVNGGLLVH